MHIQGKAMDFAIPDVSLAKLRVIGLKMQEGGVGFYPTSGSPFVHMDTGNVRHWPRMSRQQLVSVFPDGKTLDIPTDGKPLPGYEQALAAYKARKAAERNIAVARFDQPVRRTLRSAAPVVACAERPADRGCLRRDRSGRRRGDAGTDPGPGAAARRCGGRRQLLDRAGARCRAWRPRDTAPLVVAAASRARADAEPRPRLQRGRHDPEPHRPGHRFGSPQIWSQPAVPAALAAPWPQRDRSRRGASVPIAPTAVVATIDVTRPLRAEAMTTAVLRQSRRQRGAGRGLPRSSPTRRSTPSGRSTAAGDSGLARRADCRR